MAPVVAQPAADLPDLVGRLCDWSEQGSSDFSGQYGSVFWCTQPAESSGVRVYLSSPRRVIYDAVITVLGQPDQTSEPILGPVLEWLDPSSTWPRCTWSDSLLSQVAMHARDNGWSAAVPTMPRAGAPISRDWVRLILWNTYHTRTWNPRDIFMARTSTLPTLGTTWAVNPARRRTGLYEIDDALDVRIRAVFDGIYGDNSTSDNSTSDNASTNTTRSKSDNALPLIILGGLLLLGDDS